MNVSLHDIKKAVYLGMTALGAFLLIAAFHMMRSSNTVAEPVGIIISAAILIFAALICIFFGMVTFIIQDDPDVWR